MDSRGKKKKAIPTNDLKTLLEAIEDGQMDNKDPFPLPEAYWPSQAQSLKLNKAILARNGELDKRRNVEIGERNKAFDLYKQDIERWELTENRRKKDLEKYKKIARIAHLKFDLMTDRLNRLHKEYTGTETN